MLLCGDVDLVRIEPNLFGEVGWFGQRLSRGTGTIAGTTLSATGLDVGFDVAGVGAESVAMVGGVACEVIARVSANVLTVSRVRGEGVVELTPPSPVTGVEVALWTMRPQIAIVSSQVFRMLGLSVSPGTGEARLVEPQTLRTFAALWTLAAVYSAASTILGEQTPTSKRAALYRELLREERRRVIAKVDTNEDGVADAVRRPSVVPLVRM